MIFDSINNLQIYLPLNPLFRIVYEFIKNNDLAALPKGKVNLSNGVYAMVNEYETKAFQETFIECHRKYIDIQVMVSGAEQIGICHRSECKVSAAYDEKEDYEKLAGPYDLITLKEGNFVVFFPHDGHAPELKVDNHSASVRKIIFKIPI